MPAEHPEENIAQRYKDISPINEQHGVFLVHDVIADRTCVKKILKT